MVGGNNRQVSSGNDFSNKSGSRGLNQRDVSGKIAEEGRGGNANRWGARFKKTSGTVEL
jgi:hypothetical protein